MGHLAWESMFSTFILCKCSQAWITTPLNFSQLNEAGFSLKNQLHLIGWSGASEASDAINLLYSAALVRFCCYF
jgi:hypothetical protein